MNITLNNIKKSFGNKSILKDINLEIKEGAFHVILGPSGCGKSTLLNIISGVEQPDSGVITHNSKNITTVSPQLRNMGYVFQDYSLFPHLTVYDNVAFGLKTKKLSKKEISYRVKKYLQLTGMTMYKGLYPVELSGGQKQRVALSRALALQPDVILFDEPLSNLDPALSNQIKKDLPEIQRQEKFTAIYVTHNTDEAFELATAISIMNDGIIEQTDEPDSIHHNPSSNFVARFMGISNLFPCENIETVNDISLLKIKNSSIYLYTKYYPIFDKKDKIHISIHPEHISMDSTIPDKNSLTGIITAINKKGYNSIITADCNGIHFDITNFSGNSYLLGETIEINIPHNKIFPLCGRNSKRSIHERECKKNNNFENIKRVRYASKNYHI